MTQVNSAVSLGNIPPKTRSYSYVFTKNNWTEQEYKYLTEIFALTCEFLIVGKEIAPTTGTPHLQGYMLFKNQRYKDSIEKLLKGYIIYPAKGTKEQNMAYNGKDLNYWIYEKKPKKKFRDILKDKVFNKKYLNAKFKDWQQKIINICESEPDPRKIYWIWESKGNTGKTFLSKYIAIKYKAIIAEGKANDINNQVNTAIDNEIEPKLVIIDIPRCIKKNNIEYATIERLKNGMLYSGKYEGGICFFEEPHIIIFSNDEPDYEQLSADRWEIIDLNKYEPNDLDEL